ncbi:hypothetical protein LZV00_11210 [Pseudomonas kielensis]|uniref:hypothetical protein n=1 Tax=Pseudomonas kielensis TaxID=2762577 RepID=UPI002240BACA|nr:hypothetical protein [Pseudomonas kielensis]UZM16234.1 hypothetical protein LZV00_11210 [Pseudomonas kielensis]
MTTERLLPTSTLFQTIDFDTLWSQTEKNLAAHASKVWTDTAEHDPGVTLLQALTYGVSDLGYRHTLPLADLLTPAQDQQGTDGLFPADFGPHQALTVSPVTEDDYRRALLDLVYEDEQEQKHFLFRNARLLPETQAEQYSYTFDPKLREFHFADDGDGEEEQLLTVQGRYRLQVELNRGVLQATAEPILQSFLQNHRNLCEGVRAIDWLSAQDVNVAITLELEDDFQDYASLLVQIYQCVEGYLSPQAVHELAGDLREAGLSNEAIYQGPRLEHGWISALPPAVDYNTRRTLNLNPLATPLQALVGVKSLQTLAFENTGWEIPIEVTQYPQLWGNKPLQALADGVLVKLMKRGQQVTVKQSDIDLALPPVIVIDEAPAMLRYGRHRNPARYYPASDKIPPCYQLHTVPAPDVAEPLHQYLLPFEQWLASGCDQLAKAPDLLSFDRGLRDDNGPVSFAYDYSVWGSQWPFAEGSGAQTVHADYMPALQTEANAQARSTTQELALLGHLLGYFGQQRADRTLLNAPDYLPSQRAYLSQNSLLHYQAGQYRTDAISAAQRRIAARLGFDQGLFDDTTDMSKLPFYLLEHASLLPQRPNTAYDDWQGVSVVTRIDNDAHLQLTSMPSVDQLTSGQLLELRYTPEGADTVILSACVVTAVDTTTITLEVNAQLRSYLTELTANPTRVHWRNSNLWLLDINFPLQYLPANDPAQSPLLTPSIGQQVVTVSNFPANLTADDTLLLYRNLSPVNFSPNRKHEFSGNVTAKVVAIDALRRQILIEAVDNAALPSEDATSAYRWHIQRTGALADRYSFTVSAIFNEALLLGSESHVTAPYTTQAWIHQVVQEELPCHIRAELHWFAQSYFQQFAKDYSDWVEGGAQPGLSTFLFELLALGTLPSGQQGINAMRIATEDQHDAVFAGADDGEWNANVIEDNNLLYVPQVL